MHKFTFLSTCALALVATSAFAGPAKPAPVVNSSDSFFFKPYVGADYQYSSYGNKDLGPGVKSDNIIDTGLNGANIHVGARLHPNMGVELGYSQTETGKQDASGFAFGGLPLGQTKTDVKTISLDVMGYYPVASKIELIGTAGVSYAKATIDDSNIGSINEHEWKPRIGAGAQYWLADNVNARALVRYQGADFDDSVNNAVVTTVGLNYQF